MSNTTTSLYTHIAPAHSNNFTERSERDIKKVTIHHMAGNMSVQSLGELWQNSTRLGSSHYGVNGKEIGLYVSEKDIAWTDGNWNSNEISVTIEIANNGKSPKWTVSDETLNTTIILIADIFKRNDLGFAVVGENLTKHNDFSATICPGPYLESKMQYIADEVNKINGFVSNNDDYINLQKTYDELKKSYDTLKINYDSLINDLIEFIEERRI